MKTAERELARELRRAEGASLKEIARKLNVARSSVSLWVRDIELTPEQHLALRERNPIYNAQLRGSTANAELGRARRRSYQDEGRRRVLARDPGYIAGCMLYWAEGEKGKNAVRLSNSDPHLIGVFTAFLREHFAVPDEKLRIRCWLYSDHEARQREIEDFWLNLVGLPRENLSRSAVNRYSRYSKKKRLNKLPHGTCRVAVCDTRIVQIIFGSIQELGRFEQAEWLG